MPQFAGSLFRKVIKSACLAACLAAAAVCACLAAAAACRLAGWTVFAGSCGKAALEAGLPGGGVHTFLCLGFFLLFGGW